MCRIGQKNRKVNVRPEKYERVTCNGEEGFLNGIGDDDIAVVTKSNTGYVSLLQIRNVYCLVQATGLRKQSPHCLSDRDQPSR